MKTAVIYKSSYGSTEIYAKWLAEELNADLLVSSRVKPSDLQKYQAIVYGGGIYAGGVSGIDLLTKNLEAVKDKKLYLFTVGISDTSNPENIQSIRNGLEKKLPAALFSELHIYHMRGGMYYSKMSFMHRMMMKMMMKMIGNKPESEQRAEDKMMLNSYGKDVDFTDRTAIAPLVTDFINSTL